MPILQNAETAFCWKNATRQPTNGSHSVSAVCCNSVISLDCQPKERNMIRKDHLKHTTDSGPTCQRGRIGGSLRGEHLTVSYSEFSALPVEQRCARCNSSKLFAFLERQTAKALAGDWEPVADPNAWKAADDAVIAAHRARRAVA
jgi:hypothetical protein